ncbi:endo-1,4-beta xylanase [Mycena epipterygia]|nr:endo-1,4-beta xylanase [Mycena epipterygia]
MLIHLVSLAIVLAVVSTTIAQAPGWGQSNTVAKSLGGKLYFGTATDNPELNDAAHAEKLNDNTLFGQITPLKSLTWGDEMAAPAKVNKQLLRGQSCVSYDQLPNWVISGNFNASALQSILQKHCSTVVSHYAVVCCSSFMHSWDVIKEALNDDGSLRNFVFSSTSGLGSSYIEDALVAASAADPAAKLYISETNIDTAGPKADSIIGLVTYLTGHGTPIDGIGIQSHFVVGQVPSKDALVANYEAVTALGVEIAITELDIRMTVPESGATIEQQQADYQTVISACKAVAGCVGVMLSDYTDKLTLVPAAFAGQGAALLWDNNLLPKLAYDGIIAGFTD